MQNVFLSLRSCNSRTRIFYFITKLIFTQQLQLGTYYYAQSTEQSLGWSPILSINSQWSHQIIGLVDTHTAPPYPQESHTRLQTQNFPLELLQNDLK